MSDNAGGGKFPPGPDGNLYDKDKDAVNPLYLATSKSENSTLNRHTRSKDMTRGAHNTSDTSPSLSNRVSPNPFSAANSATISQSDDRTRNVDNRLPDSNTWDRLASGMSKVGLNSPQTSTAHTGSSGSGLLYARNEEIEAAVIGSTANNKASNPSPTMQARQLQLSSAANNVPTKVIPNIPAVNCIEKIILCLDVSKEMESLSFCSKSGAKSSFFALVKKALGIFVRTKHIMNPQHEFALMFLTSSSLWMCDFTTDPSKLLTIIEDLDELTGLEENCDLSSMFDTIQTKMDLSGLTNLSDAQVPSFIVRVILIYGRSLCLPQLDLNKNRILEECDYFFVDVLYVHDPPTSDNECEKIFEVLCDLDVKGRSYILEVSKFPSALYNGMAQLAAHPLQRPLQQNVSYSLSTDSTS